LYSNVTCCFIFSSPSPTSIHPTQTLPLDPRLPDWWKISASTLTDRNSPRPSQPGHAPLDFLSTEPPLAKYRLTLLSTLLQVQTVDRVTSSPFVGASSLTATYRHCRRLSHACALQQQLCDGWPSRCCRCRVVGISALTSD